MKNPTVKRILSLLLIFTLVFMNYATLVEAAGSENTAEGLFISEYVEGSSYNKAIELYNGTGNPVDLSDFELDLYSNGATEPTQSVQLSGTLEHNDVYVIAHQNASAEILAEADLENTAVINFNGNDAFVLKKNGNVVDAIGIIGDDSEFAKDITLVRNAAVQQPNATYDAAEWTDYTKDTFAYLGSHTMDGAGTEDPPDEPGDPGEMYTIADARDLPDGTAVTVEGIVTVDSNAISNGAQFTTYIQDETGGINLFAFEQGDFPELEEGDSVKVSGELNSYNGLKEVVPSSIEVLETGQELPEPQSITLADLQNTAAAESYEGELVQVNGYIDNIPESPAGGGYNISLIDSDYNGTTLRVMENALDISQIEPEKWYDITAIVSQYNNYQLLPTEQADIQVADEQPKPPSAEGTYESTVASITDGDTIHLETPVLGASKVRFLNIDTPETYTAHNDDPARDEINADQKAHGEEAKAYMKDLLQPGDKVKVKVGEEPTDSYGRLLAEIVRKEDGKNINLEMVRKGYAVTYFIAPFNEEVYPTYQNAVKEAKDAGLGIWNPDDPLLELPFVFRTHDNQEAFDKYVGNSDTMKYVLPENWADVPVEKRVFFWDEASAQANGYTFAGSDEGTPDGNLSVQLLSMNDLHGKIDQEYELDPDGDGTFHMYGKMDYTAAAIKQHEQTNPNTLIVHAGDMIGGSSPVSGLLQDEPTVEVMEEIGFDVGTVGNHEFDEGTDELLRMVNGGEHPDGTKNYDGMNFPVLCANCVYKDNGDTFLPPYHVEKVDGEKIGFVGVITQEAAGMVMPSGIQDIEFTDASTAANEAVAELKAQGVESIVLLAHIPGQQSGDTVTGQAADLANTVDDEVDVIFSAHNHVVNNGVVDGKLIVQASEYGKAFADVDVEIDRETGDIVSKEAEVVFVNQNQVEPDPAVSNILQKYADMVAPIINEVVGYNAQDLTGDYSNNGDHGLGNLIADGMNAAMDSDFAMMNGGGIRDDLLAGKITWGDLYNIQPFGNTLMMFEIKGEDLYPIIQAQLSPQYGPDYSISGFHYTWNPETNEVVDITLSDGSPIDMDETYTLTVNNYMGTSTGDKYAPIGELGENPITGPSDLEATVEFVKNLNSSETNPITYGPEGRITTSDGTGDGEQPEEAVIVPKDNNGTATVHTSDLRALNNGVRAIINIYNEKKPRRLLLNKKQVDILQEKDVTLVVTNGENSEEIVMRDFEGTVLKVSLQ
ncbi:5'-nucleotidase C-terminal domain-containing protein [Virgibacillus siamensis]|uniref:5'-nucleotidase C-terminal domain-containing protein n=1 Tax=Virgibacillus siamensis TaxID=480071 RepID=UPI000985AB3B|nr:5'-nucleotidase C-terminal domain-containing protein [Virgibacillus siamensis]